MGIWHAVPPEGAAERLRAFRRAEVMVACCVAWSRGLGATWDQNRPQMEPFWAGGVEKSTTNGTNLGQGGGEGATENQRKYEKV